MMLADRIDAGRHANIYRKHVNRLLLGLPSVAPDSLGDGRIAATCPFCVVQTEDAGAPFVFAAGKYMDRLAVTDSGLQFRSKLVVLDNSRITTSMPVPI
jgi:anthranilate 1,2-dioxygenase small subunit